MSIATVRKQRGMPFLKIGMKIYNKHSKRFGVITSTNLSGNINIRLDGDNFSSNHHPRWQLKYFDKDDNVIAEYGD